MLLLTRIEPKYLDIEDSDRQFGVMVVDGTPLCTLERPWLPSSDFPAGKSGSSCIPCGKYELVKEYSPKFKTDMYYFVNHDLGVFLREEERDFEWQRWGCMFHSANWVRQINGCIAPGLTMDHIGNENGVVSSRNAMNILSLYLDRNKINHIYVDWN